MIPFVDLKAQYAGIKDEVNAAIQGVLDTCQFTLGSEVAAFEDEFATYCQAKYGIGVNTGTSALHLALLAAGIGPGDEVITVPFTFVATVAAIYYTGATPVFVDIDPLTLNINPDLIEAMITPATKAILPVDIFASPAGLDRVCQIARKHNLAVVEDSCEALGSALAGKKAGTFGQIGVFGFYPNKQITTGEGGMIVTDDDLLADMCVSLRNQGRGAGGGWLAHERLGYNFRLSDIN